MLASCSQVPPAAPARVVIPDQGAAIVYSQHIQPIFQNSCANSGCHLSGDHGGGISLESWASVMEGSSSYGAEVIPFAATKSHLLQHISTDSTIAPLVFPRMPLGRNPLPIEQIQLIRRWIDEGAKNDAGDVSLGEASRQRIFVTAQSEDKVTVIDAATQRVARYINVGTRSSGDPESPHNITISPDGASLYVNLIVAGTVEKYNARTFEKLGATAVGSSPAQIAVTADGTTLFVSNFDVTLRQQFIVVVNTVTMTTTDTIYDVGNAPHGVVISPDGKFLYTTNALGDDITVINVATHEIIARIPASPGAPLPPGNKALFEPYQGAFTKDGAYFWFTCRAASQVRLLDVALGRVVDSITVGSRPLIPSFTPDGVEFWVPSQSSNTISIINVADRKVIATISDLNEKPHAVAFSTDGRTAFVSCENQNGTGHHTVAIAPGKVYVIDVATRKIERTIETGRFAAGIVVGPQ